MKFVPLSVTDIVYTFTDRCQLLSQLEKECSPKNYDAFFSLNYELAELRYKFSEAKDTSTQAGTNDALKLLNLARITLNKADDIQRTDDRVYEHEKDE